MAITKQDCLVLLSDIKDDRAKEMTKRTALSKEISLEIIDFINQNRQFDVSRFYDKLRKSYNDKKRHSTLYINIVRSNETSDPKDVIATLSSLGLQIILFAKHVDDPEMFLRHARYEELTQCLYHYSKTMDMIPAIKLLRLFRSDLKAFEYLQGKESKKDE